MGTKLELFILPFSGSKASQFDAFCAELEPYIKVNTIEYAGRGRRAKEPFFTDYGLFMDDICAYINEHRDNSIPYALLGYSIGGFFVYDLVAKGYVAQPKHLFICACENNKEEISPISRLPEEEFWDRVIKLGGVDKRLIERRKFLKLFSRILRADFNIAEQHRFMSTDKKIDCPVSVLFSETDTPLVNVQRWQEVCSRQITYYEFSGDHFFILEKHKNVAAVVKKALGMGE